MLFTAVVRPRFLVVFGPFGGLFLFLVVFGLFGGPFLFHVALCTRTGKKFITFRTVSFVIVYSNQLTVSLYLCLCVHLIFHSFRVPFLSFDNEFHVHIVHDCEDIQTYVLGYFDTSS